MLCGCGVVGLIADSWLLLLDGFCRGYLLLTCVWLPALAVIHLLWLLVARFAPILSSLPGFSGAWIFCCNLHRVDVIHWRSCCVAVVQW